MGGEGALGVVSERSLCWRSLGNQWFVSGAGCVQGVEEMVPPYAAVKVVGHFAFISSGEKRFHLDSSQTVLPPPAWVQVWGTGLGPQSPLPAPLCPCLWLLCTGGWEGRELDLASPPNQQRRG